MTKNVLPSLKSPEPQGKLIAEEALSSNARYLLCDEYF